MPQLNLDSTQSSGTKPESSAGDSGSPSESELRPDVAMHRAINNVEKSDKYKNANPKQKIAMQKWLFQSYVLPARGTTDAANLNLKDYIKDRFTRGTKNDTLLADNTTTADKKIKAVQHGVNTMASAVYAMYQKGNDTFNETVASAKNSTSYLNTLRAGGIQGPTSIGDSGKPKPTHNAMIEKYFQDDKNWMESRYKSTPDKIIKEAGTFIGQGPVFDLASGITEGIGLRAILNDGVGALAGRGGKIARAASAMLTHASEGYLIGLGTHDDPMASAAGFGIGGPILEALGGSATKFVGKMMGVGGVKLVSQAAEHGVNAVESNNYAATAPAAIVKMVGTPKQKVTAATVKMLNDMVGGSWIDASIEEQDAALVKLGKAVPEIRDQLSVINPQLFEMHVGKETEEWRKSVPQAHDVLTKMEQLSGSSTAKAVTENVVTLTRAKNIRANPSAFAEAVVKPGAASRDSLEFETNFSRNVDVQLGKLGIGKDKIVFEDRGHKELFYLNALLSQAKQKGKLGKEADRQFNFLLGHLNERFKGVPLSDLVKMSDAVWNKVEMLSKAGYMKEGQPVRIFRQSEFKPGESPFGHEVWLAREAAKADEDSMKGSVNHGDAALAPEGKDRRESPRVNLNDVNTIRELIDMHTIRSNQLSKELSKKGLKSSERNEIEEAIKIEDRKKVEQKNRLAEINEEKLTSKKSNGPGAAAASDPNFVGKAYGKHADLINQTKVTGYMMSRYNDVNARVTLPDSIIKDASKLIELYKTDDHFKTIADASRHYVHNNNALVDGSRIAIGKEPLHPYQAEIGKYWAEKTTMIDGSVWSNPDYSIAKIEGFSTPNYIKVKDTIKMAEDLFTTIRETKPLDIILYRGMSFGSGEASVKNYNQFRDLKPGDILDLPLSSFSHKKITADIFSTHGDNASSVLFKLEGSHKSLNMQPFNHMNEGEYVTNGAFEVVDSQYKIRPGGKTLEITIKQKGTF